MNKIFLFIISMFLLSFFSSCKDDDFSATLEVVNQSNCLQHIYNGNSSLTGGAFLGAVGANQTANFEISLDSESWRESFYNDPQNCPNTIPQQFIQIELNDGQTTTILID